MQLTVNGITKWWHKLLRIDLCVVLDETEILTFVNYRA